MMKNAMLSWKSLDILEFKEMTDEWLDFIIDCRSGKPHDHDIVIGAMADDQIYNYVSDYIAKGKQIAQKYTWENAADRLYNYLCR